MNSPDLPLMARHRLSELALGNTFAELPPSFYTRLDPTPLPSPYLVCASESAAALIGLDPGEFTREDFLHVFSGNAVHPQSKPLAAVYSGHQFGV